jgi:hypothetical protein
MPEAERPRPFPAPFTTEDWARLRSAQGVTPRALMVAARRALAGEPITIVESAPRPEGDLEVISDLEDALAALWDKALLMARRELDAKAADMRGVEADRLISSLLVASRLRGRPSLETAPRGQKYHLRVAQAGDERLIFLAQAIHPRSLAAILQHAASAGRRRTSRRRRDRAP